MLLSQNNWKEQCVHNVYMKQFGMLFTAEISRNEYYLIPGYPLLIAVQTVKYVW